MTSSMKANRIALLVVLLLSAPAAARPMVDECSSCMLGIWDEQVLTHSYGTIGVGTPKDVYLGIKYGAGSIADGLTGLEFSISGFGQDLIVGAFEPIVPTSLVLGRPQAPGENELTGGMNISWAACLQGDQAIARLTIIALSEVSDRLLQVMRKYPTSNPSWQTPVLTRCDSPAFTATRVTGGFYCLNLGPRCHIDAVESSSWSSIKQLYR